MADGRRKYPSDLKLNKVTVKITDSERDRLVDLAMAAGMNRSQYLRGLIDGNGNVDHSFPKDRAELIRQISGVATNVNQIAKHVNTNRFLGSGDVMLMNRYLREIRELLMEALESWRLRRS